MYILPITLNYGHQHDAISLFQNDIPATGSLKEDEANVLEEKKFHCYLDSYH